MTELDTFLAECDDVIADWEGSADSASWAADGSHEVDTRGHYYGEDGHDHGYGSPWLDMWRLLLEASWRYLDDALLPIWEPPRHGPLAHYSIDEGGRITQLIARAFDVPIDLVRGMSPIEHAVFDEVAEWAERGRRRGVNDETLALLERQPDPTKPGPYLYRPTGARP